MLRKTFLHAKMEYYLWLTNPRMSILLVIILLINTIVVQPLAGAANQLGQPLNLLEPLAALCNSSIILLILPFGFLVLIADYPRMTQGFLLQLYRVGRISWVLGELLELCAVSITYLLAIVCGTLLCTLTAPHFAGSHWSTVATDYMAIMGDNANRLVSALLPKNLFLQMSPLNAMARSYFFVLLYLVLIGAVLLAFSLLRVKFVGVAVNAGVLLSGTGLALLGSGWMWMLPCAHALTWVHYTEYFRELVFPLWGSVFYFLFGILLLTVFACVLARKRSFDSILEFD